MSRFTGRQQIIFSTQHLHCSRVMMTHTSHTISRSLSVSHDGGKPPRVAGGKKNRVMDKSSRQERKSSESLYVYISEKNFPTTTRSRDVIDDSSWLHTSAACWSGAKSILWSSGSCRKLKHRYVKLGNWPQSLNIHKHICTSERALHATGILKSFLPLNTCFWRESQEQTRNSPRNVTGKKKCYTLILLWVH